MVQQATNKLLEYGILGVFLVLVLGIASYTIITLWKSRERIQQQQLNQLRMDFEEMRKIARGEAFTAAEEGRKAIENNTKVLERVEDILMKLLTQKI